MEYLILIVITILILLFCLGILSIGVEVITTIHKNREEKTPLNSTIKEYKQYKNKDI